MLHKIDSFFGQPVIGGRRKTLRTVATAIFVTHVIRQYINHVGSLFGCRIILLYYRFSFGKHRKTPRTDCYTQKTFIFHAYYLWCIFNITCFKNLQTFRRSRRFRYSCRKLLIKLTDQVSVPARLSQIFHFGRSQLPVVKLYHMPPTVSPTCVAIAFCSQCVSSCDLAKRIYPGFIERPLQYFFNAHAGYIRWHFYAGKVAERWVQINYLYYGAAALSFILHTGVGNDHRNPVGIFEQSLFLIITMLPHMITMIGSKYNNRIIS